MLRSRLLPPPAIPALAVPAAPRLSLPLVVAPPQGVGGAGALGRWGWGVRKVSLGPTEEGGSDTSTWIQGGFAEMPQLCVRFER